MIGGVQVTVDCTVKRSVVHRLFCFSLCHFETLARPLASVSVEIGIL